MFGPTGAGKSTHLALIAAQLRRYEGMSIYCFDKGMSMYPLTKAVGGKHFSVAADDDSLAFCPLQFLETKGDRAWALEWISTIIELNNSTITPAQRNEISNAITNMHRSGAKTLSEFVVTIQDDSIRDVLAQYTIDGMMGHLLDAENDGLTLSSFTTFEIEELMNLGQKYALPTLLYLFRRIERDLHGQPAAIILDEAWAIFKNKIFQAIIDEWLRKIAKKNVFLVIASTQINDVLKSDIFDVLIDNCKTTILLPNPEATKPYISEIYQKFGLNEKQIELIAYAVPQRDYYYMSSLGCRMFNLKLGEIALTFLGRASITDIKRARELKQQYGDLFGYYWLKEFGHNEFAEIWTGNVPVRSRNVPVRSGNVPTITSEEESHA